MAFKVVHGWKNLVDADRGAAVGLGNFDGVQFGHRQVIADAAAAGRALKAPLGVISFEPHARMHFQPDSPSFRLSTPRQLARIVEGLGADRLYLLPFGVEMANFSHNDFAADVLTRGLVVRHVAVGFDVTFGKDRTGDPVSLRHFGKEFGFSVSVADAVTVDGGKMSSTA